MSPRREAKKFANSVQLNRPYYYKFDAHWVIGPMTLLNEITFKKRHPLDGEPMAGPHSASWYWLNYGPLDDNRDAGGLRDLQTLEEFVSDWKKYAEAFEAGELHTLTQQVARDTGYRLAR